MRIYIFLTMVKYFCSVDIGLMTFWCLSLREYIRTVFTESILSALTEKRWHFKLNKETQFRVCKETCSDTHWVTVWLFCDGVKTNYKHSGKAESEICSKGTNDAPWWQEISRSQSGGAHWFLSSQHKKRATLSCCCSFGCWIKLLMTWETLSDCIYDTSRCSF